MIVSKPNQNKQGTNNIPEKRYVPLKTTQDVIIPSKVMVIENLRVIINDDLNENFQFSVDTKFGPVHNGIIPKVDISSREPIEFNEDTKLEHIKSIIRRCGILEKYKQYFTNDPEIIINSYTLAIHKEYHSFDEFKEGLLIVEEIF